MSTEPLDVPAYAGRLWNVKPYLYFYVAQKKGDGGKDWGYTELTPGQPPDVLDRPILLSPYWQRRFAADCRYVGATPNFYPGP